MSRKTLIEQTTHQGTINADRIDEVETANVDAASHKRRRRNRWLTKTADADRTDKIQTANKP